MLTPEQKENIVKKCRDIYSRSGHACGGHLHIVLDDMNIEDHYIDFCLESAKRDKCKICEETAILIKGLTILERARLVRKRYGEYSYLH